MRDQLDLKQLAKQVGSQRNRNRVFIFLVASMFIVTAFTLWLAGNRPFTVYVNSGNGWRGIRGYQGAALNTRTAPDGTTWLLTSNPATLNRWTGDKWEKYSNTELTDANCVCGMAIDENNVWVASDKGVFAFDGENWTNYPEAIKSKPISIAASDLGIYVIDAAGNLSHFDGRNWSITNVWDILPSSANGEDEAYPLLSAAPDGTILLRWNGVWSFIGDNWEEIKIENTSLKGSILIGTAHDRLWTGWADGIIVSNLDGSNGKSFDFSEMGLSPNGRVYEVKENIDGYLFATNEGLIDFHGENWKKVPLPSSEIISVNSIETSPNGNTWIIGEVDTANSVVLQVIYAFCPMVVLIAFLIVLSVYASSNIRRLKETRQLIHEVLPDLPPRATAQNSQLFMMFLGIGYGLLLPIGFLGQVKLLPIPIFIVLLYLIITETKIIGTASAKDQRTKITSILRSVIWFLILWVGSVLIERVNPSLTGQFFALWFVITLILEVAYYIQRIRIYQNPDMYEKVSAEISRQSNSQRNDMNWKYIHAFGALSSGHFETAEGLAKEIIAQAQNANLAYVSSGLNLLGLSHMYRKQHLEALKLIEIAVRVSPASMPILTSLAEIYFDQDIEPERILEITQFARQYGKTSWVSRLLHHHPELINDAVRAWALTKLGRIEEGENLIQNAFKGIGNKYKTGIAYLYYIKGRIELAKGSQSQAAEWFTKAKVMDSGLYGQLAAQALAKLAPS